MSVESDRQAFLDEVRVCLRGSYTEDGIARWFDRPRTELGGAAPAQILSGEWNPADAGPQKVLKLARALTGPGFTPRNAL